MIRKPAGIVSLVAQVCIVSQPEGPQTVKTWIWISGKYRGLDNYLYSFGGFLIIIVVKWAPILDFDTFGARLQSSLRRLGGAKLG